MENCTIISEKSLAHLPHDKSRGNNLAWLLLAYIDSLLMNDFQFQICFMPFMNYFGKQFMVASKGTHF